MVMGEEWRADLSYDVAARPRAFFSPCGKSNWRAIRTNPVASFFATHEVAMIILGKSRLSFIGLIYVLSP